MELMVSAALCERPLNGSDPAVWSQRHSSAGEKNMLLEVPQSQQVTTSVSKCVCVSVLRKEECIVFSKIWSSRKPAAVVNKTETMFWFLSDIQQFHICIHTWRKKQNIRWSHLSHLSIFARVNRTCAFIQTVFNVHYDKLLPIWTFTFNSLDMTILINWHSRTRLYYKLT